jgi:hypothetical protein
MLRTEKEHFAVLVIASHSLDDGHPSLYGKRMGQVTFGNNLSIDVENDSPFLTVEGILLYVDGDVHDLDLHLHPSALLHGGIPTCFQ